MLPKVLGSVGSELWFPWSQLVPIGLYWRKRCLRVFLAGFYRTLFIHAGNADIQKSLDEFEIRPYLITDYGVSWPWVLKSPIDLFKF